MIRTIFTKHPLFSSLKLWAALFALQSSFANATNYVASTIELNEDYFDHQIGDVNGDKLRDLLISVWSQDRGRELLLFLQNADGKMPGRPSKRIEIKKDIVAYTLADVREEPGVELIFFSRSALFSYSTQLDGYSGNLKPLLNWDFINTMPDNKRTRFFDLPKDLNGDDLVDFLLPGPENYGVFLAQNKGNYLAPTLLPKPVVNPAGNRGPMRGSISIEKGLSFETLSPFDNLIVSRPMRKSDEDEENQNQRILSIDRWLPTTVATHLSSDTTLDLLFVDDITSPDEEQKDKKRINIVYQDDGFAKEANIWQQELELKNELHVANLNDDGLSDLYAIDRRGADQVTLRFFLNDSGKFNFNQPNQVMRLSGFDAATEIVDINGDGRSELLVSYYGISTVDALRSGSMLRTTLIYSPAKQNTDAEGDRLEVFTRRPAYKLEEKFSASAFQGLTQRIDASADVDGDGKNDAVALNNAGALEARTINDKLQIESEAFWQFAPLHLVEQFKSLTLNTDAASDFILKHQNSLTVLVSQP